MLEVACDLETGTSRRAAQRPRASGAPRVLRFVVQGGSGGTAGGRHPGARRPARVDAEPPPEAARRRRAAHDAAPRARSTTTPPSTPRCEALTDYLWEDCCKRGKATAAAEPRSFFASNGSNLFGRRHPMNILKPHVSLNVSNIDASVAFYEKAFGVAATKRRPGYAKFDLAEPVAQPLDGGGAAHRRQREPLRHPGREHRGRGRGEDPLRSRRASRRITEENTSCCYAVQDKVWVEDPDGNSWEVFVVKADADRHDRSRKTNASACRTPSCSRRKAAVVPVRRAASKLRLHREERGAEHDPQRVVLIVLR